MTTKEQLDEALKDIQDKFKHISEELESLYQDAIKTGNRDFADRVERIQFSSYANPFQYAEYPMELKVFYDIIEENESSKNLDEYRDVKAKLDAIERIVNRKY